MLADASFGRPCKSPRSLAGYREIDLSNDPPWSNSKLKFHEHRRFRCLGRATWTSEFTFVHIFPKISKPLKNIENQNCHVRSMISTVLSSLDFPLACFLPFFFLKKNQKCRHPKTHEFHKTLMLSMKYHNFDI